MSKTQLMRVVKVSRAESKNFNDTFEVRATRLFINVEDSTEKST